MYFSRSFFDGRFFIWAMFLRYQKDDLGTEIQIVIQDHTKILRMVVFHCLGVKVITYSLPPFSIPRDNYFGLFFVQLKEVQHVDGDVIIQGEFHIVLHLGILYIVMIKRKPIELKNIEKGKRVLVLEKGGLRGKPSGTPYGKLVK